jgi:hypothetical protein
MFAFLPAHLGIFDKPLLNFTPWSISRQKMSIEPLPSKVIAQIKSSIAITSLNGVVAELFKNSLDASSSKIDITVDYLRGTCIVEDDGLGIPPAEFREEGGLGKLHRKKFIEHVSKYIRRC